MSPGPLLHADADSFFASVALRSRPELVGVPLAAVAHVFVASATYPARARGVRGGMSVQEALGRCPELVLVEVPHAEVEEVADALFDLFGECATAVEPGSVEEAFLDVGAAGWDDAVAAGHDLRRRAAAELGIPVSVGVGRTKLMAKLASRAAKPDGLHVLGVDREHEMRSTLPVEEVWGIGRATRERLTVLGVHRLADVDGVPADRLQAVCGTAMARRLRSIRTGTDDAQVRPVSARTRLSAEGSTSGWDRADRSPAELAGTCVARLCRRAERAGLTGTELRISATPRDGAPAVTLRRAGLPATADVTAWQAAAATLLASADLPPLAGLRVTVAGLSPVGAAPLTLF
jgi:DNA polymerase-4